MNEKAYTAAESRHHRMPYRRAGRSGLQLPPLSLGFWQNFGYGHEKSTMRTIVRRAFDLGVIHLDLANNYGPPAGRAEENVGEILRADFTPHRDELVISTKAGFTMWEGPYGRGGSRKHLLASLDGSLKRLGLDYVDIFYHHCPDDETPLEETMQTLADIVRSGRALYVGLSNYSPMQARSATRLLKQLGTPPVLLQNKYSMFDRTVEDGLLAASREVGAGIAAFSPLHQGLLTDRYRHGVPQGSRAADQAITSLSISQAEDPVYQQRVARLAEIAHTRHQSLAQLALVWALRHPEVSTAIVGASSRHQLEQNIGALQHMSLSEDELTAIDEFAIHGTAG